MTADPFFDKVALWSRWKHEILSKYLNMWVFKLQHGYKRLTFVDTCAGAGEYGDGSIGSPLLAARWNEYLKAKGAARLVVHACETTPATMALLERALHPYTSSAPPTAYLYSRPYYDVLEDILKRSAGTPTLFFIDPYGPKDITVDRIRPILNDRSRKSVELILRIDPNMLQRMAGWLRRKQADGSFDKTSASFKALLARLNVDTSNLEEHLASRPRHERIDANSLMGEFLSCYQDRFKYVQLVPIRPSYESAPKYLLMHGTDSADGAALFNDAVSTTEDSLYTHTLTKPDPRTGQPSLFSNMDSTMPAPKFFTQGDLQDAVRTVLHSQVSMRFIELRAELAIWFGAAFREKDHKAAVKALMLSGEVEATLANQLTDGTVLKIRRR